MTYVSNNLEKGKQTDVLVMDFAMAFDKGCHNLLLHKLHHFGIQGKQIYGSTHSSLAEAKLLPQKDSCLTQSVSNRASVKGQC